MYSNRIHTIQWFTINTTFNSKEHRYFNECEKLRSFNSHPILKLTSSSVQWNITVCSSLVPQFTSKSFIERRASRNRAIFCDDISTMTPSSTMRHLVPASSSKSPFSAIKLAPVTGMKIHNRLVNIIHRSMSTTRATLKKYLNRGVPKNI